MLVGKVICSRSSNEGVLRRFSQGQASQQNPAELATLVDPKPRARDPRTAHLIPRHTDAIAQRLPHCDTGLPLLVLDGEKSPSKASLHLAPAPRDE